MAVLDQQFTGAARQRGVVRLSGEPRRHVLEFGQVRLCLFVPIVPNLGTGFVTRLVQGELVLKNDGDSDDDSNNVNYSDNWKDEEEKVIMAR